jgi:transcriptional regulator with XRE-family HTH domain
MNVMEAYMARLTLGSVVRNKREILGMSRAALAMVLGISKEFLGHVECDAPVHVSDDLCEKLRGRLGIGVAKMAELCRPQIIRRARWKNAQKKARRHKTAKKRK